MPLENYATYLMPDGLRYKAVRTGDGHFLLYPAAGPAWAAPRYELRPDGRVYCRYGLYHVCGRESLVPQAASS